MTNHWIDMLNANVVLIMGGKPGGRSPDRDELAGARQGARHLYPARRPAFQSHLTR